MQSLALPRPTSSPAAPLGHPSEPEDGLAKLRLKFSPRGPEQQGYPSPPMSEPHSPTRRPAQTSEPLRHSYHAPVGATQRTEGGIPLPPPSSALFQHQSALTIQSAPQRQLYPGESQPGGQHVHHQAGRPVEQLPYGTVQVPQNYPYGYSPADVPAYTSSHHAGPMGRQSAMLAPPSARPTKPARRTKAHVASACVNCKKAHLSCDIQRPCGRCVSSGKQVSADGM